MKQALKTLLAVSPDESAGMASVSASRLYISRLLAAFEQESFGHAPPSPGVSPLRASTGAQLFSLPDVHGPGIEQLSVQEHKVLSLLVAGRTYTEMAETLVVSLNTIKTQVSAIYRKLGVGRRTQAIEIARQRHLL